MIKTLSKRIGCWVALGLSVIFMSKNWDLNLLIENKATQTENLTSIIDSGKQCVYYWFSSRDF